MSRTPVSFHDLQPSADDLAADTVWVDADRLFSLHLLQIGNADES